MMYISSKRCDNGTKGNTLLFVILSTFHLIWAAYVHAHLMVCFSRAEFVSLNGTSYMAVPNT